ncbi:MAG: HD domain-containing protein [Patescibacteria group bacterium]
MNIREIQALYKKYQTPEHVQRHMEVVAKVAVSYAKKIQKNGKKINIQFIRQAALLHDFLKMLVFKETQKSDPAIWKSLRKKYPNTHDSEVAAIILEKKGEKKLAEIVRKQQFEALISKENPLKTLEEKVVYYADKRVAHDQIVTLAERLKEGEKRYGTKTPKNIEKKLFELEKEIKRLSGS